MGRADHRFLARFVLCLAPLAVMDLGAGALDRQTAPAACALLSRPEIEGIVNAGLSQGEPRVQAGAATMCRFTGKRGGVVTILIRRIPGEDWVSRQIERMSRSWPTFREAPGIGERSFLYDMKEAGAVLCVFRGDYYIQISLVRMEKHPPCRLQPKNWRGQRSRTSRPDVRNSGRRADGIRPHTLPRISPKLSAPLSALPVLSPENRQLARASESPRIAPVPVCGDRARPRPTPGAGPPAKCLRDCRASPAPRDEPRRTSPQSTRPMRRLWPADRTARPAGTPPLRNRPDSAASAAYPGAASRA